MGTSLAIAWALALAAANAGPDEPRYAVRRWTSNEGLPRNTVFTICQQQDSTLVLGTDEGAFSFDGRVFHHLSSDWLEKPKRRFVMALLENQGDLWIGTLGDGVVHRPAAASRPTTHLLEGLRVTALAKSGNGDTWIGARDGVRRVRADGITRFGPEDGFAGGEVFKLATTADAVWAASERGVWRYDGSRWEAVSLLDGTSVSAIGGGAGNRLWFATAGGLLGRLDGGVRDDVDVPEGTLGKVNALLEAAPGTLWIASAKGVFLLHQGRLSQMPGTRVGEALALFEDREHDIWVGLNGGGLLRLRRTAVTVLGEEAGLKSENVLSVAGDGSGGLWVGTETAGVASLRDGRVTATYLAGEAVSAVVPDGRSGAYVGLASGGVRHVADGRVNHLPELAVLDREPIYALLRDETGLWIGTHGQGVYWMDGGRLGHLGREPDRGLPSNRVYALERHHSGGIWVGTSEGVVLVQNGRVEKRVPLAISALTLHEDADGVLWIGTDGDGLHWLRGETLGSASRAQGLFSNIVFQILEELPAHGGALWMSCNHGLFRVRKSDLFDLQEGRSKRFDVDTITHDDGMEEEEANGGKQPAGWRDGDGALWFATIGGVAKVAPGLFAETRNTEPPVVRIDAVLADGAALADPLAPAAVPPGRGKLEIRYAATSLASPAHIQFRHRLMGFDDDWVDTGEQAVAQYTNLPPGEYRFLVKAGRGRFWSQEKSTGPIELQPHFHQRTSFRAAVALMVVLLGMAAYQARARRWRAETMVLAERNRLAREIHDGLMQGLTGILMQLQAAVALWSAGGGGPLEHVERALEWTRFSLTDARLAVTAMGREIASVKALSEVLQRCAEALTAGTPIRAEVTAAGEDALPPKVGAALLRIGQEAMGNATRHGRPRRVSVEIAAGHAEVRMAVKDDGRGFDPGAEVPGSSNGLRNMRERALAIGGRHEIRSAPGEGTEVIVVAPLAPARRHRPDPLRKS